MAAGFFFSDRISIIACLHRLFSVLVFNEDNNMDKDTGHFLLSVKRFCESLLGQTENGHSKIVHRLVELIKVGKIKLKISRSAGA